MLKKLLKIFFPQICSSCSYILLENENFICTNCRHNLPLTNFHLLQENEGFKKFYGRLLLNHVSCMLFYTKKGTVQKLIHNLKYKNHQEIGAILGNWYVEDLKNIESLKNVDFIVPVPLHPKRLKKRGYNQISTFCEAIALGLDKKITNNMLFRSEYNVSQSKKNLANRNLINQTTFQSKYSKELHNKHFLLIDDVLTTGATLEACGHEILKIPGSKLSIVTIAMSLS